MKSGTIWANYLKTDKIQIYSSSSGLNLLYTTLVW